MSHLGPYVRNLTARNVRGFASAAALKRRGEEAAHPPFIPPEEVKSGSANNVKVVSLETNQPVSRLGVFFRAGSRFETDSTQGVVHMLRICAGLGTSGASHFGISRHIDAAGGHLNCTTTREHVCYTLTATRDKFSSVDKFLYDVAVNQVFKPWEVSDNVPRARLERQIRSPETRVIELINKAVYRKGLGYSLYSPKWMLGNHSSEMLSKFVSSNFVDAVVVGVGMPHQQALDFASRLNLKAPSSPRSAVAAKFHGGADLRKETTDSMSYVALAVEGGATWSDPRKATATVIVARALGSFPPNVQRGLAAKGKLAGALGDADSEASVSGFSQTYTDSSLIGALIAAPPSRVDQITRKAADVLRSTKFTGEDAKRAKEMLKVEISLAFENGCSALENMGLCAVLTGKAMSLADQLAVVDSVTADDMNAVLGKKLSLAAFGHVANVPYVDDLK